MATLVLTMTLDPTRADEVLRHVREDVIPWVRRMRGFRSGRWVRSLDHGYCLVLIEFDTEADAEEVRGLAASQRDNPARSWNFDRIVVAEELAMATRSPDRHG